MHIEIDDNTTLLEIQEVFSNFYPYLRIGVYKKPHKKYEALPAGDLVLPLTKVGNIKPTHVYGLLEIQPWYTVAGVEKEFQQRFGLSVQVLRKEKDKWIQTTGMDDFTLKELNELSRNSSDEYILSEPDSEFMDFE